MKKLIRSEKGQGLVEYALILVLVAIVVLAVLLLLGPTVGNAFSNIVANLQRFTGGGSGVIQNVSATNALGNLTVTINVATSTNVTISGDVSHPSNPCSGSCTFNIGSAPAHGTLTVTAAAGGSVSTSW